MYFPRSWCFVAAVVCLLSLQFSSPARARADSYVIVPLANDNRTVAGMDDVGHVVLDYFFTADCAGSAYPAHCYYTFTNGVLTGLTSTLPSYDWDYSLGLGTVTHSGWTATRSPDADPNFDDLYVSFGANAPQLVTKVHGLDFRLAINGVGDILFDNATQDEWYEARNLDTLPAPEPSSLILLLTGVAGAGLLLARRGATV